MLIPRPTGPSCRLRSLTPPFRVASSMAILGAQRLRCRDIYAVSYS
jgi:hypothetical protein